MVNETDYAWAAGIVDGEGAICMTLCNPGTNGRKSTGVQVRISVRMVHEETIRRLHSIFGGTVKIGRAKNRIRHRDTYEWFASDMVTLTALRKMLPYMTTKKEHAALVIEYRETCCPDYHFGAGRSQSQELVEQKMEYFNRLRVLNMRGKSNDEALIEALLGSTAIRQRGW